MLFNHIKRTEMVKNVQLYENIRDSSAAYMVSGRRPAPHENRQTALKKARRCRAGVRQSYIRPDMRKRGLQATQMPDTARTYESSTNHAHTRRIAAIMHTPGKPRLTFLQMKNIIITERAANLRKSSFAARFIFKLDMIVKSV